MTEYIRVAFCNTSSIKYIPMERDGSVSLQTFRSLFPGASGMFFESKHDQFIITLHNGYLHPPSNGWQERVYYPIYKDLRDEDENQDDYVDENEQDENDDENDGYIDDDYDNNYYDDYDNDYDDHNPQDTEPEDFYEVYSRMLREKHQEELHNEESDYDE